MAEDDGPTQPGVPFDPVESDDGPTLQVHIPPRSLPRLPRPPSTPGLDTATLPRFPSSDFDQTATRRRDRSAPSQPVDDADETLTLRRGPPSMDEVATTKLAPVPSSPRLDIAMPPASERTRPFALLPSAGSTAPFPLVRRDQTESLPKEPLLAAPVLPPAMHAPPPAPRGDSRAVLVFAASLLATLAVALVIVVVVLAGQSGKRHAEIPNPAGAARSEVGSSPGCAVKLGPRALGTAFFAAAAPIATPALSPGEVAIGYAETRESAAGVVVDLSDLSVERRLAQVKPRPIARVTPYERDGSLAFVIDHDGDKLATARTVADATPFVIGVNYFGVARATPGEPETIWPGGKGAPISEPMIASVSGVGHAVAFSRGRFGGSVHVGWLGPGGRAKTDLGVLELAAYEVGSPAIAAGPGAIAVAVAIRDTPTGLSRIVLATAAHGSVPRSVVELPGADRSHPVITALADGGWLVAWIEGGAARRVRAQRLGADLSASAPAFDVATSPGIEQALGALQRVDRRVLSAYVVRGNAGPELWGAMLECG